MDTYPTTTSIQWNLLDGVTTERIEHILRISRMRIQLQNAIKIVWILDMIHHKKDDVFLFVYFSESEDWEYLCIEPINTDNSSIWLRYIKMDGHWIYGILFLVHYCLSQWVQRINLGVAPEKRNWRPDIEIVRNIYKKYGFRDCLRIWLRFDYDESGRRINERSISIENPNMYLDLSSIETLEQLIELVKNLNPPTL